MRQSVGLIACHAVLMAVMLPRGAVAARNESPPAAKVLAIQAVEAILPGRSEGVSAQGGGIVPSGVLNRPVAPDDSDLRVLLPFEERHDVNVIYTRIVTATRNLAGPLDDGILDDPELIEPIDGRSGNAFMFKGGRIHVPLPHLTLREVLESGCTVSAWIRPEHLQGRQTIAVCSVNNHWHPVNFYLNDGKLGLCYHPEYGKGARVEVKGETELQVGRWQHVAAAFDPFKKQLRVYLNGRPDGQEICGEPQEKAYRPLNFLVAGYPTTGRDAFQGAMDDVMMLTRPVSDSQAADLADGKTRYGSFDGEGVSLDGAYNTIHLSVSESNPGTSQVFIRQNEHWHRARDGQSLICDMPARMPVSTLTYKVVLAGETELKGLTFELENRKYTPDANRFSFLVMGDSHLGPMPQVIKWAYETYSDLALITGPGDIAGVYDFYASYLEQWSQNPNSHPGLFPWFLAQGNHDIEYPRSVDFFVRRVGPGAALSLPGMRDFREGPYDTYPGYGNFQDRFLQYSFDYLNTHFVILNVYYHDVLLPDGDEKTTHNRMVGLNGKPKSYVPVGHVSEDMLTWLRDDLAATKATFKFLFFHEGAHPAPFGRHFGDSLDSPRAPGNYREEDGSRPMRDRFWSLLAANGVTATFVGHSHHTAQTWAADPAARASAVYEFESGGVANVRNAIVVSIDGDVATVKQYTTSNLQWDFHEKWEPVVFNKNPEGANCPVKLVQFDASRESYSPTDRRQYRLEVGTALRNARALFFEGRDNDLDDKISFRFKNLPEFFSLDDQSARYRRMSLSSGPIAESHLGEHAFTVVATDGQTADSVDITLSVLPQQRPVVLGSPIPQGARLTHLDYVPFVCTDNVELNCYTEYPRIIVDGTEMQGNGQPFQCKGWWRSFNNREGIKAVNFRGPQPFGRYEIHMPVFDMAGLRSDPYVLGFEYVDDGLPPVKTLPWVMGVWPQDGAKVLNLPRVRVWVRSRVGTTRSLLELTEVRLQSGGRDIECKLDRKAGHGGLALTFDKPLSDGPYTLKVKPIVYFDGKNVLGKEATFTHVVDSRIESLGSATSTRIPLTH